MPIRLPYLTVFLAAISFTMSAQDTPAVPANAVPQGTIALIQLTDRLDTHTAKAGDHFQARLKMIASLGRVRIQTIRELDQGNRALRDGIRRNSGSILSGHRERDGGEENGQVRESNRHRDTLRRNSYAIGWWRAENRCLGYRKEKFKLTR